MKINKYIEEYISFKEALILLGCSKNTLYTLVKRPDFPSYRIGNRWLIDKQGLHTWIYNNTKQHKLHNI